jgi:type I restriction enzyme S subunit
MYPITAQNGLLNCFLFWFLLSKEFTAFAVLESDRVAMPKINRESLAEIKLPVPPEDEQKCMVDYIEEKLDKLDVLTERAEHAVGLLKERRTALISAAVTGKIDVRNWQPVG